VSAQGSARAFVQGENARRFAPHLAAILPSNEQQIERGCGAVIEKGNKKVGVLGFSFKAGTDDLREARWLS